MLPANLRYNPYIQSAELLIDNGKVRLSGRLGAFITGQPISEWLEAYSIGYRHWEGFLPELVSDLNEDNLSLKFSGITEDFAKFHAAIIRQNQQLQRMGYSPSEWTLEHVPAFLPERIIPAMSQLVKTLLPIAPSQASLIALEAVAEEENLLKPESVKSMYARILAAIGKAADYCREMCPEKIRRWENAQEDLSSIITRGGL